MSQHARRHPCDAWSLQTSEAGTEKGICAQVEAAAAYLAEPETPIKRLLLLLDLARQGVPEGSHIPLERWSQVLRDLSLQ